MALTELLRKAQMEEDADVRREGFGCCQALVELEASQQLGARQYERTPERTGHRNGYRDRPWDTRMGTIQLKVPKVREGSSYPSLLDPRKRAERALVAVVQEAYVQGVSTRRVDDLVQARGMNGVSKEPGISLVPRAGRGGGAVSEQEAGRGLSLRVAGCRLGEGAG
jgi:putative transposase